MSAQSGRERILGKARAIGCASHEMPANLCDESPYHSLTTLTANTGRKDPTPSLSWLSWLRAHTHPTLQTLSALRALRLCPDRLRGCAAPHAFSRPARRYPRPGVCYSTWDPAFNSLPCDPSHSPSHLHPSLQTPSSYQHCNLLPIQQNHSP
jgi:hypothetical protein